MAEWLETPPGRYLLAWEQAQLDRSVADVFGFHALQLGLPELDALRDNRMPHRWLATDQPPPRGEDTVESPPGGEVPDEEPRRGYSRAWGSTIRSRLWLSKGKASKSHWSTTCALG